MSFDHRNLTRREATYLRQLAQMELARQQQKLSNASPADPPQPGARENQFVLAFSAVETLERAIAKLRRLES